MYILRAFGFLLFLAQAILALGGLEVQLAGAYELVELPLKRIFHIGVPGRSFGRLGPELFERYF